MDKRRNSRYKGHCASFLYMAALCLILSTNVKKAVKLQVKALKEYKNRGKTMMHSQISIIFVADLRNKDSVYNIKV